MLQNREKEEAKLPPIAKEGEVEVCSEEEGFVGAWYRAILEECPTKSKRKKLRVRYTTLLHEDSSSPLYETVRRSFIRPVPPEHLYDGAVFAEGSVVDADLKDGWWHGVVAKRLEDDQFLVCFDTPPDILQFHGKQLRPHLDWTGSQWVRPENKELSKSLFSSGTMVEVSREIDKLEVAWFPAIVIKEVEVGDDKKKCIVKTCCSNKSLTFNSDEVDPSFTVDLCNIRPLPPPSSVEEYTLLDRVEAFRGSAWRQCLVRGILSDNRYAVSFVATKEESEFKHSDLRPSKVWEDGVWRPAPERKLEKETPPDGLKKRLVSEIKVLSRPKKLKVIRSCSPTKPITPAGGNATESSSKHFRNSTEATEGETVAAMQSPLAHGSGNQMADGGVMNGAGTPVINNQVIPTGKESAPLQTPKETLQPMRMKNGLGIDSNGDKTPEEHSNKGSSHKRKRKQKQDSNPEENVGNGSEALNADTSDNDDYDQPLSAWILGGKSSNDSDKSKLSPDETPKNAETQASEDTIMVLPFVKRSPIWKTFESMEMFKTAKQSPHFTPLLDTRQDLREGLAVAEMVNFSNLLEDATSLQIHTPKSTLEELKERFYEREKYGFDITEPISRINMLVSLIDENVSREVKLKEIEKEKTEAVSIVQEAEEDLRDVERKIVELQNQKADLKVKKDAEEKKIAYMQLCAEDLDKKLQEGWIEFQKIMSASW